jgi:hypothetical protein
MGGDSATAGRIAVIVVEHDLAYNYSSGIPQSRCHCHFEPTSTWNNVTIPWLLTMSIGWDDVAPDVLSSPYVNSSIHSL